MGQGEHGGVDSGAVLGLLEGFLAPAGLVAAGYARGDDDLSDVVPSYWCGLSGASALLYGSADQSFQKLAYFRVLCWVGAGAVAMPMCYSGEVGSQGRRCLSLAQQGGEPPLKILGFGRKDPCSVLCCPTGPAVPSGSIRPLGVYGERGCFALCDQLLDVSDRERADDAVACERRPDCVDELTCQFVHATYIAAAH